MQSYHVLLCLNLFTIQKVLKGVKPFSESSFSFMFVFRLYILISKKKKKTGLFNSKVLLNV